jgi:hypothetical protein
LQDDCEKELIGASIRRRVSREGREVFMVRKFV